MIEIKLLAAILLLLRLIAVFFLSFVIHKQLKFLRQKNQELTSVRIVLMTLLGLTLIGNIVPIIIDIVTLARVDVSGSPSILLTSYALSNALTGAISAIGWWVLYKVIDKERIAAEKAHDKSEAKHADTLAKAKRSN